MFHVIQISSDLLAGSMSESLVWTDAVELALTIIKGKGVIITKEIEEFVNSDGYYVDDSGEWSVCIVIPG